MAALWTALPSQRDQGELAHNVPREEVATRAPMAATS